MKNLIVAMTGASGAVYGRRLLERLETADAHVHLVCSEASARVLKEEESVAIDARRLKPGRMWKGPKGRISTYDVKDIGCRIASGAFAAEGMIVIPCSTGRLGSFASGLARDLIDRAAAVCLKERRRLVLVPRETPLGLITLENMTRLARAGAVILPAAPGFYQGPKTVLDLVDFVVDRALLQIGEVGT